MNYSLKKCSLLCGTVTMMLMTAVSMSRANVVINTFDSAAEVSAYSFFGWNGSPGGPPVFSTNDASGSATSGSIQLSLTFLNPGEQGGSFVSGAPPVDVSTATNIEFDLMVDPASPLDPNGNVCYFQFGFNSPSYVNINPFWLGPSGKPFTPGVWQHFKIAITPGALGTSESQFFLYPYDPNCTSATTPIFYVDNIVFDTPSGPLPGPTVTISKPQKGLNVFASTANVYDRESARLKQNTGKSWVGLATAANPVSYSFTISHFPTAPTYSCEAYMFLVPNPSTDYNAPDYSDTDCIIAEVQATSLGSQLILQYKVNEPGQNAMFYGNAPYTNAPGSWDGVTTPWYERGNLGGIQSTLLDGTYSLKFTSSSNVTLITPDGSSTNLVIPSYNATDFAETSGFNVYLGMQANDTSALGQAVVYSNFAVSNSATPFSDNFLADTALDTNNWDTSLASGPAGIFVVPASAAYWVNWTLPASGYSLQVGTNLSNISTWSSVQGPVISADQQLVDSSELPAGGIGFFNLVKRKFTQLQVLLPGETNAPGTATGKIGTPTTQSLATGTDVIVNAVDSTFHIVNGPTDLIQLTCSDTGASLPNNLAMVNGTATFTGANNLLWGDEGTFTVTANDVAPATTIPPATSSPVVVGP
jgi:hypothetical protein